MPQITINLTDKENAVLLALANKQDISPERILIQGLRLMDALDKEAVKLVFPPIDKNDYKHLFRDDWPDLNN